MKKLLRKWLCVPDETFFINRGQLKKAVKDAITEAFEDEFSFHATYDYFEKKEIVHLRGVFEKIINAHYRLLHDKTLDACDSVINKCISGEKFLDSIIERIKNKQLN